MNFSIPIQLPNLGINDTHVRGQELYKHQINHLGNALLIHDYNPQVDVNTYEFITHSSLKFPPGALISGSFLMKKVAAMFPSMTTALFDVEDIDIYFKSKQDAIDFTKNNSIEDKFIFNSPMCSYGMYYGDKYNLIYGVSYDTPADLISKFDIRACAMACDPNKSEIYLVKGAVLDLINKEINFNPVPRGVSIRRLTKYIKKGFRIDDLYQRLFFAELIRSNIYSTELELITGY